VSQGWTVSGRALTDIQSGQVLAVLLASLGVAVGWALVSFLEGLLSGLVFHDEKSNVSLGRPTFLRAALVARLENMSVFIYAMALSSSLFPRSQIMRQLT
jgi:hypothetical protein